jgi:hypothetical protein
MIKPGYRTSEFWLTVVSFIFSGLYLIGLLDDHSQKENLIAETSANKMDILAATYHAARDKWDIISFVPGY